MVGMARANRGFFSGMPKPIDSRFLRFVNHIGLEEVSKIFSDSVDLDETRKAFAKVEIYFLRPSSFFSSLCGL
jgi:hypothetical protein